MKIKINWEVVAVAIIMVISFFIVGTLEKANERKYQDVMSEVYDSPPVIIQPKTTYHPAPQVKEPIQEPKQIQQELPEMLTPCGISENELATQIKGLAPYAEAFLQAEEQYGINAKLLIAISALESGWGTSELAKTNNNLFGWTSSSGYASFNTVEECTGRTIF